MEESRSAVLWDESFPEFRETAGQEMARCSQARGPGQ